MEVCNIPELHLYTGTINLLWNNLATRWGQEKWEIFLERNSLVRQKLHGGEFEGHQCKRLMRLANKLRDALPKDLWGFYDALGAFDTMAHSCFSKVLSMDFEKAINDFLDFFIALEIKTKSTKLHILSCYVKGAL